MLRQQNVCRLNVIWPNVFRPKNAELCFQWNFFHVIVHFKFGWSHLISQVEGKGTIEAFICKLHIWYQKRNFALCRIFKTETIRIKIFLSFEIVMLDNLRRINLVQFHKYLTKVDCSSFVTCLLLALALPCAFCSGH
jgi:hypothetical protein